MNLNLLQTRLSLKTRLSLYLALIWTKYKIKIFFQKIKSTSLLVQHIKGHPDSSTYVRKKGCVTFDTNRDTPCIYIYIYIYISKLNVSISYYECFKHYES